MALVLVVALAGGGYLTWTGAQPRSRAHDQPLPRQEFGPDTNRPVVAAGAPAPVPTAALAPDRLAIPALGVAAAVRPGGITDRQLDLPGDVRQVTRWSGGAAPADRTGTVLIAGHVDDFHQGKGALWPLFQARPNESIVLTDATGRLTHWRVVGLRSVVKAQLPQDIFAATGPRRLILVTCGGQLIRSPGGNYYQDNVVVTALPV